MPNSTQCKASVKILNYVQTEGIKSEDLKLYAWFPVKGHSMTNEKKEYSIPEGSIILGRKTKIDHPLSFPMHCPVLLMGIHNGEPYAIVKEITFIDAAFRFSVLCMSYNDSFSSFWIPLDSISTVFKVEQIKRPGSADTIFIKPKKRVL